MTPTETEIKPQKMRSDARRNRDAVLEAARERFAAEGFEVQMDDIARAAGVGVGTVYRHFPTKEDLLDALIHARFHRLTEMATAAVAEAEEGDAWRAFEEFILASSEIQTGDRALSEAMASRSERMSCAAEDSGLVDQLELLVAAAKRSGDLRKDFIVEDIPSMICSIGAVSLASQDRPRLRWDRVLAIWLDGVRGPGNRKLPPIPE